MKLNMFALKTLLVFAIALPSVSSAQSSDELFE